MANILKLLKSIYLCPAHPIKIELILVVQEAVQRVFGNNFKIKLICLYICYIKPSFSNLCSSFCSFRLLFSVFFSSRSTPSSLLFASNSSALDLRSWKVWLYLASNSSFNLSLSSSNSFLNLSLSASVSLLNLFWSTIVKSSFNLFSISSPSSIWRRSSISIEFYIEKSVRMNKKHFNTNMKIKINTLKIVTGLKYIGVWLTSLVL